MKILKSLGDWFDGLDDTQSLLVAIIGGLIFGLILIALFP